MSRISQIVERCRSSDRVRVHPAAGTPTAPQGMMLPAEVTEFYSLCGGIDFLDADERKYAEYRILAPAKVKNIGDAIAADPATEPPMNAWFAIGEDDNGEHAAVDLDPSRSGRCYDVFHETYFEAESARIVADSFAEFVERLFEKGKSYWFDDGYVDRYFPG